MKTKYINRPSSYMPIEQLKIWLKENKAKSNTTLKLTKPKKQKKQINLNKNK